MRAFVLPSVFVVALSFSSAACGTEDLPQEGAAPVTQVEQPIIGGLDDNATANNAVVSLFANGGACTGTVFRVDGSVTWILTAAHCIGTPMQVAIGPDYENPSSTYQAATATQDVRYGEGEELGNYPYDVGVVKVNSALPVTPIALADASDGLAQGATVTSYGYGTTIGYTQGNNSQRHSITRPIASLTTTHIVYDQSDETGICAGDSGGPVVAGAGAARRLVGVHSNVGNPDGDEPCFGQANSVRVSSRFDFIDAVVNGTPLPQPSSCQVCSSNASSSNTCNQKRTRCINDDACSALAQCLQSADTDGAVNTCISQNPEGVGPYVDFVECGCSDVCVDECVGEAACSGVAKCGIAYTGITGSTLTKCIEENCCAEADAASADGEGYVCLSANTPAASCASNAKYAAYKTCMDANCEKAGSSSSGGSSGSSGGDDDDTGDDDTGDDDGASSSSGSAKKKKTTTTTSGCSVSDAGGTAPGGAGFGLVLGAAALLRARRRRA